MGLQAKIMALNSKQIFLSLLHFRKQNQSLNWIEVYFLVENHFLAFASNSIFFSVFN